MKPAGSFALNVNGYMVTTEKGETEASFGTEVRSKSRCTVPHTLHSL